MNRTKIIEEPSTALDALASEVQKLFREAIGVRNFGGVTGSLRLGYIRDILESGDEHPYFQEATEESCDETDDGCDNGDLGDACSIEDTMKSYKERSPFSSLASLLTTVKKYEFISLIENAYAQIGNKPFKLKAGKDPVLTDKQVKDVGKEFYSFLENFLETNEVRIDQIPVAFNLNTLGEVTSALADVAQEESEIRISESINANEAVLERVFQRSDFMAKYIEVIKDTTDYPIGILWIDDKSMKKERYIKDGKLALKYSIQSDAHRVDPSYFWATEDHRLNDVGRAVFRLTQYSKGDLLRWKSGGVDITGSEMVSEILTDFLEHNPDGSRMHNAMLFNDHMNLNDGMYDVVVSRGTFDIEHVKALGVNVPKLYEQESFIPCEIYFAGSNILRVRIMETADERLGVYTTVFRRKGQSIFGWSLHDFIYPFAKMYASAIDAVDLSVGKSVGSFIQVDTGVMKDATKYLKINDKTGESELDLNEDTIIEFDSTMAGFGAASNFKGVPITATQLPSDLNKLIPVIDLIHKELEKISGIPSILTNGSDVPSALRTTSNFNAAFSASAKVVKSLLRESEMRILEPGTRFIFDAKAMSGDMGDFLTEIEPEILLSDTLTRELNDDQQLSQSVQQIAQFGDFIPPEKMSKLINTWGREVHNLTEDLIPGTGVLSTSTPSTPAQAV